jgi:hypothetical protein
MERTNHDVSTGEITIVELTEEEIAIKETIQQEEAAKLEAETAKSEAKAALLDRLGITEDEAKLLLG